MKEAKKMMCPDCGVEMNRHALKVDYGEVERSPEAVDPDLGGILEEAHACPACGKTSVRRVADFEG